MPVKPIVTAIAIAGLGLAGPVLAQTATEEHTTENQQASVQQQIAAMQQQIEALQQQLDALRAQQQETTSVASAEEAVDESEPVADIHTATSPMEDTGITVGGAVRFQYSNERYNDNNARRVGDMDFDIFRLDLRGKVGGIILDAQWRWFQYMSAVQHAWVGYDFSENSQLQIGLTRIPFGNQGYNSHSYFFSSNYYVGLEDTMGMGTEYVYAGDKWNVQLAFFKNDGTGGVDAGGNRTHSYSYNVVGIRPEGEGIYATPSHAIGAVDTFAARVARTFAPNDDFSVEVGASALHGGLDDAVSRVGDYYAWALHTNVNYGQWNFQAQALHYDYDTDNGATRLATAAYAYYDTMAAEADGYSLNVAYTQPVAWGPITSLTFYNDYSVIGNKSGNLPRTFMDVLGVAVSAGDLYTYIDYVTARNQPFIGGSMAGDGGTEHRLNINFGFYF